jgi:hypothetical protein
MRNNKLIITFVLIFTLFLSFSSDFSAAQANVIISPNSYNNTVYPDQGLFNLLFQFSISTTIPSTVDVSGLTPSTGSWPYYINSSAVLYQLDGVQYAHLKLLPVQNPVYLVIPINATLFQTPQVNSFTVGVAYTQGSNVYSDNIAITLTTIANVALQSNITSSITEGDALFQSFKLRTAPSGPVTINITANAQHGEYGGVNQNGVPYPGGGSLFTLSKNQLTFTPSNWNQYQSFIIQSPPSSTVSGNRWSTIDYTILTADSDYQGVTIVSNNITILDPYIASVFVSQTQFSMNKTSPPAYFQLKLTSAPTSNVSFTLRSNSHFLISPNNFLFNPSNWNALVRVSITPIYNTVIEGEKLYYFNATMRSSDPNYEGFSTPSISVILIDVNVYIGAIVPAQGKPEGGTRIIVNTSPSSFLVSSVGDSKLPSVSCVWGDDANTRGALITQGNVTGIYTVSCVSPLCNPNDDPLIPCAEPYYLTIVANNVLSQNKLLYEYISPPQLNSIAPDTIDLNQNNLITLTGLRFSSTPSLSCIIDNFYALSTVYNNITGQILCMVGKRSDLGGSTNKISVTVRVAVNGQEFSNSRSVLLYDYDFVKQNTMTTIYYIILAIVFLLLVSILTCHYCCRNCRNPILESNDTVNLRQIQSGPEKLIDLLAPEVDRKAEIVRRIEELERAEVAAAKLLLEERKAKLVQLRKEKIQMKMQERQRIKENKLALIRKKQEEMLQRKNHKLLAVQKQFGVENSSENNTELHRLESGEANSSQQTTENATNAQNSGVNSWQNNSSLLGVEGNLKERAAEQQILQPNNLNAPLSVEIQPNTENFLTPAKKARRKSTKNKGNRVADSSADASETDFSAGDEEIERKYTLDEENQGVMPSPSHAQSVVSTTGVRVDPTATPVVAATKEKKKKDKKIKEKKRKKERSRSIDNQNNTIMISPVVPATPSSVSASGVSSSEDENEDIVRPLFSMPLTVAEQERDNSAEKKPKKPKKDKKKGKKGNKVADSSGGSEADLVAESAKRKKEKKKRKVKDTNKNEE